MTLYSYKLLQTIRIDQALVKAAAEYLVRMSGVAHTCAGRQLHSQASRLGTYGHMNDNDAYEWERCWWGTMAPTNKEDATEQKFCLWTTLRMNHSSVYEQHCLLWIKKVRLWLTKLLKDDSSAYEQQCGLWMTMAPYEQQRCFWTHWCM